MSIDIRLPNITAQTESGKIEQIKSYLFQLTEQLKWALNSIESSSEKVQQQSNQSATKDTTEKNAADTFNSIKALIIKSADIVESYSEKLSEKFSGEYVAISDFGTYTENTLQEIIKSPDGIEQFFTNIQKITTDVEKLIEANARINSGLLYYDDNGVPIYGLEIGQINEVDGVEVFNKYARFTSEKLSFYDKNDTEIAYISDYVLHITHAKITGTLTLGRFVLDASDGLACRWV